MRTMIVENNWLPGLNHGWGNGYVLIPEGNHLHGKDYDTLNEFVDVNGGLTFSELVDEELIKSWKCDHDMTEKDLGSWVVGFDTAHYRDTIDNWPKEAVQAETERLLSQLQNINQPI